MNKEYLLVGFISAIITSGITLIGQIIVTYINRKYDDKKHQREMVMQAAIDAWKLNYQEAELFSKENKPTKLYSLEMQIVKMHKLSELVLKDNIKPEELKNAMQQVLASMDAAGDGIISYTPNKKVDR